jgi:hypothetical protein
MASVGILGLSLALSGCGRHTTDGTNATTPAGTGNSTTQPGGTTGGVSVTDLQSASDSFSVDLSSLSIDENAAMNDQANQDVEVQP